MSVLHRRWTVHVTSLNTVSSCRSLLACDFYDTVRVAPSFVVDDRVKVVTCKSREEYLQNTTIVCLTMKLIEDFG